MDIFDTGIGLPPERQQTLFRPFAQARGRHDTRLGGSGLGLAICRDIVSHLGGELELSSTLGVGTAVRVELPARRVPPAAAHGESGEHVSADAAAFTPPSALARGPVLLVEDHPANRQIIAAQVTYLGYTVTAVSHGQAALNAFSPGRYVGVLLDCELPDMSGYDIAAEMRAAERLAGVAPVRMVAISANEGEAHQRRCADSGIDLVLGKPLSLEALRAALVVRGPDAGMLAAFRDETRRDIAAIRTALETGDTIRARQGAHRVKGAALMCGVIPVADLAEELEEIIREEESAAAAAFVLDDILACVAEP